jgi:VWFA-related protein
MTQASTRLVLLTTSLVCAVAARQNPPQPVPLFRGGVDLVVVDVSVLDRDRRPVRGLTAADFTILENGRPQPIAAFSAVDLPDVEEPGAPWIRDIVPDVRTNEDEGRRIVLIVLDDAAAMEAAVVPRVKQAAHRVIDHLAPDDLASIIFTSDKRGGQEFTHDRTRLRAAVDKFMGAIPDSAQWKLAGRYVPDTLRQLAESVGELPQRRKALFIVSTLALDCSEAAPVLAVGDGNADVPGETSYEVHLIREFLSAAQRANVNVYGIDPRGLAAPESRHDALTGKGELIDNPGRETGEFLQTISTNTGGFAILDTNDLEPGIVQVFKENNSYYLLGYASPNPRAEGRFRRVQVRVNRPGVIVRSRSGYFEREAKTDKKIDAAAAASPLIAALAGVAPKTGVPMQVSAAPFAIPGRRQAAVAIVLGLRQPAPETRAVENVDLMITAYDANSGRPRGSERLKTRMTLRGGIGSEVGYELLSRLDLEPGRYHLRLAAMSALRARTGSVYCDLDVPDFTKPPLSLSGLVLSATPALVVAPRDRLASLVPVMPTTRRTFSAGDGVTVFLRVYQGGRNALAAVTMTARILDSRGIPVFDTTNALPADRFSTVRSADYRLAPPLAPLTPGLYLLTLEAKLGNRTVRRDLRFTMR